MGGCSVSPPEDGQTSLEFIHAVISASTVRYSSSYIHFPFTTLLSDSFTHLTMLSSAPLTWLAVGVANFHSIKFLSYISVIIFLSSLFSFQDLIIFFIALDASIKIVPLSLCTLLGTPYKLMNLLNPSKKVSVDKSVTSSR